MEMELMGMECFNLSMCLGNSDALFFSSVLIGKIVKPLDAANSSEHRKLMETQWKAMEMDGKSLEIAEVPKVDANLFWTAGYQDISGFTQSHLRAGVGEGGCTLTQVVKKALDATSCALSESNCKTLLMLRS